MKTESEFASDMEVLKKLGPNYLAYAELMERLLPLCQTWWESEARESIGDANGENVMANVMGSIMAAYLSPRPCEGCGGKHVLPGEIARTFFDTMEGSLDAEEKGEEALDRVLADFQSGNA